MLPVSTHSCRVPGDSANLPRQAPRYVPTPPMVMAAASPPRRNAHRAALKKASEQAASSSSSSASSSSSSSSSLIVKRLIGTRHPRRSRVVLSASSEPAATTPATTTTDANIDTFGPASTTAQSASDNYHVPGDLDVDHLTNPSVTASQRHGQRGFVDRDGATWPARTTACSSASSIRSRRDSRACWARMEALDRPPCSTTEGGSCPSRTVRSPHSSRVRARSRRDTR